MDLTIRHEVAQPTLVTLEDMTAAVGRLSDYDLDQLVAAANAEIHDREHAREVAA